MWARIERLKSALLLSSLSFLAACIVPYEADKWDNEQRAVTPMSNGGEPARPAGRY